MDTSTVEPASVSEMGIEEAAPILSPVRKFMLKPIQWHVPLFLKRQVLVKDVPAVTRESSGIVTSSSKTACILQFGGAVFARAGVSLPVMDVNGVVVGGSTRDFVGGRVDVTN